MDNIAWEHLEPLERARIARLRPDVYRRIKEGLREEHKDNERENYTDEQRLNDTERKCR